MLDKNKNDFGISVIIPVYNAVKYVEQAVNSALEQAQVREIILVWDGCDNGSLELCKDLTVRNHGAVRLFTHEDKKNHGAGASRNLGIKHAKCGWIAFLDADDFFLPERFEKTEKIAQNCTDVNMIYESVGTYFENDAVKKTWLQAGLPLVAGMTSSPPANKLFESQTPLGNCGYCHLDGLTIKKEVLYDVGFFNEKLRLHQDTDILIKLAALAKCYTKEFERIVSMRRAHSQNRITSKRTNKENLEAKLLMWTSLISWGKDNLSKSRKKLLLIRMIHNVYSLLDGISRYSKVKRLFKIIDNISGADIDKHKVIGELFKEHVKNKLLKIFQ